MFRNLDSGGVRVAHLFGFLCVCVCVCVFHFFPLRLVSWTPNVANDS